ncbi:metallopeptidase [Xylaria nigripes]|nr:metallopeptidase [Xylaria nigripes]
MAPRLSLSFKQLRRRSIVGFRSNRSIDNSNTSSNDEPSSQELSSVGSITPPSLVEESNPALRTQVSATTKPSLEPNINWNSVAESVISEPRSSKHLQDQSSPLQSQYALRLTNIRDKATVYQKVLLVTGVIGQDPQPSTEGMLRVDRPDHSFPPILWPVYAGQFKALVYLFPGPNKVSFVYQKPGVPGTHSLSIVIYMFPPTNAPPLDLAILVAKDSPCTFDCTPARTREEGNDLEIAVRKFRMAAYLWQSFTADQMEKGGFGRRSFRFDEEWTTGTSHQRDFQERVMRSEARVHIIRTDKTVAEIRAVEQSPQNSTATVDNELVKIASTAVRDYFRTLPNQQRCVAMLILDTQWDATDKTIKGHVAFGGPVGNDLHLALFGSHCLQSYPSALCGVVPAFSDCTPMELKVANDETNTTSNSWEVAAYGIGAHLHELGRLLGSPRQEKGIMAKDFVAFSRAFLMREAYSARTKSKGGIIESKNQPIWHRLDLLPYRFHPMFRNSGDKSPHPDTTIHGWVVEKDKLLVTARSGLLCTEIYAEGDDCCTMSIEHPHDEKLLKSITMTEGELRSYLPEAKRRSKLKIIVRSIGGKSLVVNDVHQLCTKSSVKLTSGPLGQLAFRSTKVGFSQIEGSEPQEIVFSTAVGKINRILTYIDVYHGDAVDGLEFYYDDGSSQLFGKRGGVKPGGDRYFMANGVDILRAEVLVGFSIRAGSWIDAIQIVTTLRRSSFYGNAKGGSTHHLIVPRGFKLCGVSGTCAHWIDSFGLLITR